MCIHPNNQPIYQMLMDNAQSLPDRVYSTAEMLRNLDYDMSRDVRPGEGGVDLAHFCIQWEEEIHWFLTNSKKIPQSVRRRMMDALQNTVA
jgi:hypothetical protein